MASSVTMRYLYDVPVDSVPRDRLWSLVALSANVTQGTLCSVLYYGTTTGAFPSSDDVLMRCCNALQAASCKRLGPKERDTDLSCVLHSPSTRASLFPNTATTGRCCGR